MQKHLFVKFFVFKLLFLSLLQFYDYAAATVVTPYSGKLMLAKPQLNEMLEMPTKIRLFMFKLLDSPLANYLECLITSGNWIPSTYDVDVSVKKSCMSRVLLIYCSINHLLLPMVVGWLYPKVANQFLFNSEYIFATAAGCLGAILLTRGPAYFLLYNLRNNKSTIFKSLLLLSDALVLAVLGWFACLASSIANRVPTAFTESEVISNSGSDETALLIFGNASFELWRDSLTLLVHSIIHLFISCCVKIPAFCIANVRTAETEISPCSMTVTVLDKYMTARALQWFFMLFLISPGYNELSKLVFAIYKFCFFLLFSICLGIPTFKMNEVLKKVAASKAMKKLEVAQVV